MKIPKALSAMGWAVLLGLASASTAAALPFTEIGDAGELPGTAQIVSGAGALTSISGSLTALHDRDMYAIMITGGGTFSATTSGPLGDPQLFLFTSAGLGVYTNDDTSVFTLESTLPAGHPLTPLAAGLYYLAISEFNDDPVSAGGLIFPSTFPGVFGATGSGGGSPIIAWTTDVSFGGGSYTITLTGAEFVAVPEPSSLLLLGSALAGLGLWGRRRFKA